MKTLKEALLSVGSQQRDPQRHTAETLHSAELHDVSMHTKPGNDKATPNHDESPLEPLPRPGGVLRAGQTPLLREATSCRPLCLPLCLDEGTSISLFIPL